MSPSAVEKKKNERKIVCPQQISCDGKKKRKCTGTASTVTGSQQTECPRTAHTIAEVLLGKVDMERQMI